jgi:hypothetical protein
VILTLFAEQNQIGDPLLDKIGPDVFWPSRQTSPVAPCLEPVPEPPVADAEIDPRYVVTVRQQFFSESGEERAGHALQEEKMLFRHELTS